MARTLECITLSNVVKEFGNIAKIGNFKSINSAESYISAPNHAQGSNYYVDTKKKRHFIVTYSSDKNYGYLLIYPERSGEVGPIEVHTPEGYNHPGGFQIVGDYLFLPCENYKRESKTGAESIICVYDLTPLADGNAPLLIKNSIVPFKEHKAGMLGVTDKWIGIHDNSEFYLYKINEFKDDGNLSLTSFGSMEIKDFQAIGLIKQSSQDAESGLFLLGLCSHEAKSTFKDSIWLYPLKICEKDKFFALGDATNLKVTTDHGNGAGGWGGIHFRYGGGVYLYKRPGESGHIMCLGTGRNIYSGLTEFNYNEFPSEQRIEVVSRQKPLEGQEHRSSQNFAMKGISTRKVKFTIYKNGEEVTEQKIKFQIFKDKNNSTDYGVYSDVINGDIRFDSEESPLYIHSPSPEADAEIKIVIEGTNG